MGSFPNLNSFLLSALIFISILFQVQASLTLSKECGDIKCKEYQFCDPIDHTCKPCSRVCNQSSNNFDENRCVQECQDHIHDERYIKNGDNSIAEFQTSQMYRDLQQDIRTLKILVGLSVGLTAICLIIVIIVFIVFLKKYGGPKPEKSQPLELNPNYNNANKCNGSEMSSTLPSLKSPSIIGLGNNNSVAPMKYDNAPPSITHRFQREPSESTLPEYAYDNASLSPTSHHV